MMSKVARILVGTIVIVSICSVLFAQEKTESKIKIEVKPKQVAGVITSVSPNFIAVETGLNEEQTAAMESAFNLDKQVRVIHKNSLKDLKVGETVSVSYEETIKTLENGKKSRTTDVISITFLKPAPRELTAQEQPQAPAPSEPSVEEQNDEAPLSLKGLKGR